MNHEKQSDFVQFNLRIKCKGNERLIAQLQELAANRKLTQHLLRAHRQTMRQLELF